MDDTALQIAKEALRQTELRLEDTQKNAGVAETRASHLATVNLVLATLLVTLSKELSFELPAFISAIVLVISAFIAVGSVMPRKFHSRGHFWREWSPHIDDRDTLFQAISSQAAENDTRIADNERSLETSASLFRVALRCTLGAVTFFVASQVTIIVCRAGLC